MFDKLPPIPQTRSRNKMYYLLIFLFSLIFLWPLVLHPTYIPMSGMVQVTDFTLSHLSYTQYIHDSWCTYGKLPLWNSSMLSGMPLVADPLSGYFYLPNWLTFLFPKPITYNFLFVIHLFWMGVGIFLFLKPKCKNPISALFGAVIWMGAPKLIGYLGSGQVSSVFALAWFPWLLLAIEQFGKSLSFLTAIFSSVILSIIILIDIRWGYLAGLFAVSYAINILLKQKIGIKRFIVGGGIILFLTIILTAVLILPLSEMVSQTDRANMTVIERGGFSLTGTNLIGILTPQAGIISELITYMGLAVLFFAGIGIRKKNWYWVGLICFSVLFSLGENIPLFDIISNYIPGFEWLRVPSRLWFFVVFACAILAAFGVDHLMQNPSDFNKNHRAHLFLIGTSFFAVLLAIGMAIYFSPLPHGLLQFAVIMPTVALLFILYFRYGNKRWIYLLLIILVADLLWFNTTVFQSVPLKPKVESVQWLEAQTGLFRVYSPSGNILPPHVLQTAEGVNPSHLKKYSQFIAETSKIEVDGYSVSVPAIYLDQNSPANLFESAAYPDLNKLGLLNVKYIVTDFPLKNGGVIQQIFKEAYVSLNPHFHERVWFEGKGETELSYWSPDLIKINVNAKEAGQVVLSEINYPGWEATLNNQPVSIQTAHSILRAVSMPPGVYQLVIKYVPIYFYIGLIISAFGWLSIWILYGRMYVKKMVACF